MINALREVLCVVRKDQKKIALIPTMGNLHKGHIALIEKAQKVADYLVVSIFVNPTQFIAGEDFESYPRTLDNDLILLKQLQVDTAFVPITDELYSHDPIKAKVIVPELDAVYCGKFRPGHFQGVATIVTKLFNIVQPDVAFFGEKDYQQLLIIQSLVKSFDLPIEIIGVKTVREKNGLAISSRNQYLDDQQRQQAPLLYQCLCDVANALQHGEKDYKKLETEGIVWLKKAGFKPEYLRICDASTLKKPLTQRLVIICSAWLGKARLIDNVAMQFYD